jgi:TIR domain
MNEDSKAEIFDVFLCCNSEDKPAIREIARRLAQKGIKPWIDEEQIRPGTSWQKALGQQFESIKSAAVLVGESGVGPWQDQEIQAFLNQFQRRPCPIIPVILASAKTTPNLPWTLADLHWVDFRESDGDPLGQLIWGITGKRPPLSEDQPVPKLTTEQQAENFDVFLCCNSEDKPAVREIARKLAQNNLKPWLDEEEVRPGESWQTAISKQMGSIKSTAVFVGESGLGPWLSDSKLNATESPKLFATEKKSHDTIVLLLEQAKHQQQTVS